jgi:hypothetical protein
MERTKSTRLHIPDAINCSKESNYTQIPNKLLRNPEISGKSKSLLCLLLSNRKDWHSYVETIKTMMKEETSAINSGLKELETFGYLKRIRYRDIKTKTLRGSFWAYTDTPFDFDFTKQFETLKLNSLEPIIQNPHVQNSIVEKATLLKRTCGKLTTKNTNSKEEQNYVVIDACAGEKSTSSNKKITPSMFNSFWELYPKKDGKGKALTLWETICTRKNKAAPTWEEIEKAIKEQIKTNRWKNKQFIPNPCTWLNQNRWLDDPKEMVCFDRTESSYTPKNNPSSGRSISRPEAKYRVDRVI